MNLDWNIDRRAALSVLSSVIAERFGPVEALETLPTWGPTIVVRCRFPAGSQLVVKCSGRQDIAAEAVACRLASDAGLPAPQVIATGDDTRLPGRFWLAMSWLTGVPWADLADDRDDVVLPQLADHFARLHSVDRPGFGSLTRRGCGVDTSWADWLATDFTRELGSLAGVDRRVSHLVDQSALAISRLEPVLVSRPGRLVHADLGDREVLVDRDSSRVTGLVDWGSAIVGDPLYEFAKFVAGGPVDDPRPGRLQPILRRHYAARTGVDWPRMRPLMALYEAHNAVANANWAHREGTGWTPSLLDRAAGLLTEAVALSSTVAIAGGGWFAGGEGGGGRATGVAAPGVESLLDR